MIFHKPYAALSLFVSFLFVLGFATPEIKAASRTYTFYFMKNSARLTPSSRKRLRKIRFPRNSRIIIKGYADSLGSSWYNRKLSRRRACLVRELLKRKRIKARYTLRYYGEKHPLFSNRSSWGRRKNRRVTIVIIPPASSRRRMITRRTNKPVWRHKPPKKKGIVVAKAKNPESKKPSKKETVKKEPVAKKSEEIVAVDTDHDGKVDLWKKVKNGQVTEYSEDIGLSGSNYFDGKPNAWVILDPNSKDPKTGKPCVKSVRIDSDKDGIVDKRQEYENCRLKKEVIDQNENGTPEEILTYDENGKMTRYLAGLKEKKEGDAKLLRDKDSEKAEMFYKKALKKFRAEYDYLHPEVNRLRGETHLKLAKIYERKGDPNAIGEYEHAILTLPRSERASVARKLGKYYFDRGEYRKAKLWYGLAINYDNSDFHSLDQFVECAFILKEGFYSAIRALNRTIRQLRQLPQAKINDQHIAHYLWLLGQLYNQVSDHVMAEKIFKESLEKYPKSHAAWIGYSWALFCQKKLDAAIKSGLTAHTNNPREVAAAWNLGLFYWIQGSPQKAKEYISKAIDLNYTTIKKNLNSEIQFAIRYYPEKKDRLLALEKYVSEELQRVIAP